jgi:hypothetical protein
VRAIVVILVVFGLPGLALLAGFRSAPGQTFAGDRTTNILIGAVLLGITAYTIRALFAKATLRIDEHANGLRWLERGIPRTVLWREIAEIRGASVKRTVLAVEIARTTVVRLRLENGHELVLSNMLAGVELLIARLEREVGERVLSQARATLADNGVSTFGPVALTKEEVRLADPSQAIPWSGLQRVDVANGVISFRGEPSSTIEVEWSKVPNANALLVLVEERLTTRNPT